MCSQNNRIRIGLWMYSNDGGNAIQSKLKQSLEDMGCDVYNNFDLRKTYVSNGKVLTDDGFDLTSLDAFYHMNAEERNYHQDSILQALEFSGVLLINPYRYYRVAKDKFYSNYILQKSGIRVPQSVLIPNEFNKFFIEKLFGSWGTILLKPRFGFGGKGIIRFHNVEQFYDYCAVIKDHYHDFYLEKFIDFIEKDYRVEIINGEVIGGYSRVKEHSFKTNVSSGATLAPNAITDEQSKVATQAVKSLNLVTSIVDMIYEKETNELFVLEVNDSMGVFVESCLRPGHRLSDKYLEPSYCYDELKVRKIASHLFKIASEKKGKAHV